MQTVRFVPRVLSLLAFSFLCTNVEAGPINLLFERNQDADANQELAIAEFNSLADIITYAPFLTQFSSVNISSVFNVHGATWDGTALRVLFERAVDGASGQELAIASFSAIGSLIAYNPISTLFSTVNVASSFSVAGLTYDGLRYHLAFERDVDAEAGLDLAIATFNAFDDLINYAPAETTFSNVNLASAFNVHGFDFDGSLYHLLFERDVDGAAGQDLAIASFSSIADILTYNPLITEFSNVNVASAFDVAGFFSMVDFGGGTGGGGGGSGGSGGSGGTGHDPVAVPEPPTVLLLVAGLAALGRQVRRR